MPHNNNQPTALPVMFLTEMWERFGFYVVQGLLVLYTTQYFGYSDNKSYSTLGAFTALAYISPIVGGRLADRMLGFITTVIWGGLILVLGYAMLAIPSKGYLLFPGLATIIIGTGMFKPSISSLLGAQYKTDDTRREAGFTIFYIGINLGAFMAGISSGYIKNAFGWHASFMLASIGLIIGVFTFLYGLRYIKHGNQHASVSLKTKLQLLFYGLLAIIGISFLLQINALADWVLPCFGVVLIAYLTMLTGKQTAEYRKSMTLLNILIVSSVVYWMMYFQMFFSANLFVDRLVDKHFLGFTLTTTMFYASESVFIILLGPLIAWAWLILGRNRRNPSTINKFIAGIFCAGMGFLILSTSTLYPNELGYVYPGWVFFSYLLITIGELLLSPIGLSAVTTLAPSNLVGFMMGVWFVAIGFGGVFAGVIAKLSSVPETAITLPQKLAIYHEAFLDYAYIAFFVAIVLFFSQFLVRKYKRFKS
jgi:POT family proton-dependent oligopeptide transporter